MAVGDDVVRRAVERVPAPFLIEHVEVEFALFDKDLALIQDRYFKQFARLCSELGLSPQSRAKLAISITKKEQAKTIGDLLKDDDEQ